MNQLIILRGLPGSGKSTIGRKLLAKTPDALLLSTDDYFMVGDIYAWEAKLLAASHAWNQRRVSIALNYNRTPLVDNTNTTYREMQPYLEMANAFEVDVTLFEPTTEWAWDVSECFQRNAHNVPRESIQRMLDRYESCNMIIQQALGDFPQLTITEGQADDLGNR